MSTIRTRIAPVLIGLALAVGMTSVAAAEGGGGFGSHNPWNRSAQGGASAPTQQSTTPQAPPPSKN